MSHVLLITSSPRGADSLSTRFATEIAEGIQARLNGPFTARDLAANPPPHIAPAYIHGRVTPPEARTPEQAAAVGFAQELVDELKTADVIVLGSGMINFGLPSQLKAWFDHITWPGVTFSYGDAGLQGLLTGKKVYLVTAAGGVFSEGAYAPFDFQTNYLLHLLGFIGLTDVEAVRIEGTAFGPDAVKTAIANTETTVKALLAKEGIVLTTQKKIALFGATGPTGRHLIEEALKQGYNLSVYTRNAKKLESFAGKIEIVVGDLQDLDAIAKCIQGADAVISALGPNSLKVQGDKPIMHGLTNIIAAMKQAGVRRLIQISTAAYRDPKDGFALKAHAFVLLFKVIVRKAYEDIKATGELIANSGLDWTLVRIPNLKDGSANGQVDVGWYGRTKLGMKLSRGNLAKFLVDQVTDQTFMRAAPGIANH
jgi:FMN-dependent NADH-azoreductase/putative NADH-flavin reductase